MVGGGVWAGAGWQGWKPARAEVTRLLCLCCGSNTSKCQPPCAQPTRIAYLELQQPRLRDHADVLKLGQALQAAVKRLACPLGVPAGQTVPHGAQPDLRAGMGCVGNARVRQMMA